MTISPATDSNFCIPLRTVPYDCSPTVSYQTGERRESGGEVGVNISGGEGESNCRRVEERCCMALSKRSLPDSSLVLVTFSSSSTNLGNFDDTGYISKIGKGQMEKGRNE